MASSEDIAQFQAITGADEGVAAAFLDMAGGSVDVAVSLFFDGGAFGDGGGGDGGGDGGGNGFEAPVDIYNLVWAQNEPIPEAWIEQTLAFSVDDDDAKFGLPQAKNGPCGVLTAIHGVIAADAYEAGTLAPDLVVEPADVVRAIAKILVQAAAADTFKPVAVATWADASDGVGGAIEVEQVGTSPEDALDATVAALEAAVDQYTGRGCMALVIYSAVLCRGRERVVADMAASGGVPPLVTGPFWLCTSDLMALLLKGEADGNVGAYSPMDASRIDWPAALGVGMLSYGEIESGVALADQLKTPSTPVWILHSEASHFTLLFSTQMPPDEDGASFEAWHYNGLPPGGPRMTHLRITAPNGAAGKARKHHQETYFKPVPGTIDDVVQAHPDDKRDRPNEWRTWRYEIVLTIDDPTVDGAERPPEMPLPPTFTLDEPPEGEWRCASCYATRFKTMCFGQNGAEDVDCRHCGKNKMDAGWSLWFDHDDLPGSQQRQVARRHGPKIITLLQTKWPRCEVEYADASNPPTV